MPDTNSTRSDGAPQLPGVLRGSNGVLLLGVAGAGLGQAALSVAVPLSVARAFDQLVASEALTGDWAPRLGVLFAALGCIAFVVRWAERSLSEELGQRYVHRVRLKLWDHMVKLPTSTLVGPRRAGTLLRFVGDLNALKAWVSRGFVASSIAMLSLSGGLGVLFHLSPRLGALVAMALSLGLVVQSAITRQLSRRVKRLRRDRARLADHIVQHAGTLGVIQASNQRRRERRRMRRSSQRVARSAEAVANRSGWLVGSGELLSILILALVLVGGAEALRDGRLSSGEVVAALLLARFLGRPVRRLSRAQEQWLKARVSKRKLNQFLSLETLEEPTRAKRLKSGTGAVKLRELGLHSSGPLLNATVRPGDRVELCGTNGIGKSTLLRVLSGLGRPARGRLVLDGRDVANCRLEAIRGAVSLVTADLPLLRGSLRRNLLYGLPSGEDADLDVVLRLLDLGSWIESLPRGLETRVQEGGLNLSAGQRQRVAIARALLSRPRLLLLDEANTTLDKTGVASLREVIEDFEGTVIYIWPGTDAPEPTVRWKLSEKGLRSRRLSPPKTLRASVEESPPSLDHRVDLAELRLQEA
ncbi:MAG: ABC transporter ATP-binding protein [Acidobacteriota bacterium]